MVSRKAITSFLLAPSSLWQCLVGRIMGVSIATVWGLNASEIEVLKQLVGEKDNG